MGPGAIMRIPPPPAWPPPAGGAGTDAGSIVHVPEKSSFCAKAIVAIDSTAAAITPALASFMFCSLL
jgi:hypothetical protein